MVLLIFTGNHVLGIEQIRRTVVVLTMVEIIKLGTIHGEVCCYVTSSPISTE